MKFKHNIGEGLLTEVSLLVSKKEKQVILPMNELPVKAVRLFKFIELEKNRTNSFILRYESLEWRVDILFGFMSIIKL